MQGGKAPRVGIIGTGWGVTVQVPAFREAGWQVVAICGRTEEKTKKIGADLSIPFTTADPQKLIEHLDVDFVTIVLPPHTHKELSLLALRAGKHVMCDKPTSVNASEAEDMLSAAKERPNQLSLLDFELRTLSSFQEARAVVKGGKLGKILHIRAEFFSKLSVPPQFHWWWERSKGGGLLGAVGTHIIDYMSWILGQRVVSVSANLRTLNKERCEEGATTPQTVTADDSGNLSLVFSGGTVGDLTLNMYGCGPSAKKVKELIFSGDKGTLYLEFNTSRCEMQVYDNSNELLMKSESEAPPKNVPNHAFGSGTYVLAKEVAAYLAAPSSVPAHLATFEDGLYVQRVVDAAWESSDKGGVWVNVPSS